MKIIRFEGGGAIRPVTNVKRSPCTTNSCGRERRQRLPDDQISCPGVVLVAWYADKREKNAGPAIWDIETCNGPSDGRSNT